MAGAMLTGEGQPLPAASVLVVRDAPFEVLMLQRHGASTVAPDAWVFPGGVVDPADRELALALAGGSTLAAMRIAAVRETFEEAGIWLGVPLSGAESKRRALIEGSLPFAALLDEAPVDFDRLVLTSRWITPVGIPRRFDTWFFVAPVGRDAVATAEQKETVEVVWIAPGEALERRREMKMLFPTLRNLEAIALFASSVALIESRRGAVVEPVQPVLVDGKPTLP